MKKICLLLAMGWSCLCQADSVLDLLKIVPSKQSSDFVENKGQYHLHTLLTEQRHSKTWDLSHVIQGNTSQGLEMLLSVDEDICRKFTALAAAPHLLEQAVEAIKRAILENRKIYVYGCGATGRLAKQVESGFWRPFWQKMRLNSHWKTIERHFRDVHGVSLQGIEERLVGEITGADRALISSLEGFEDLQLIGRLQLEDHHIKKGDVVFAVTEGGETSSVIGTILTAASQYNLSESASENLYFIYNNPDALLLPFDRSRSVLENPAITKICLATGPQAIAGSTRMQATTSETFIMGMLLEQALYELLSECLSKGQLEKAGFAPLSIGQRVLSFLPLQQLVYNAKDSIGKLTDLESTTYRNKGFATYFAQAPMIVVFTDATERAPTFRLFPLDRVDVTTRKSWIQVWTAADEAAAAWRSFLKRPFYGLDPAIYEKPFSEEIQDPYLRAAALRSLQNAGNEQQNFYDFSLSPFNMQQRGPEEDDLGVLVLTANEIDQLESSSSFASRWLKCFGDRHVHVAAILLPSQHLSDQSKAVRAIRRFAPAASIVQLPVETAHDPLGVRQQIVLKMALNAHSTAVMSKLGRTVGNTMTNVNPGNLKLVGRATFLIMSHVNDHLSDINRISYKEANAVLYDAMEYCKQQQREGESPEVGLSIIRILEALKTKTCVSWPGARDLLEDLGLEGYLRGYQK